MLIVNAKIVSMSDRLKRPDGSKILSHLKMGIYILKAKSLKQQVRWKIARMTLIL